MVSAELVVFGWTSRYDGVLPLKNNREIMRLVTSFGLLCAVLLPTVVVPVAMAQGSKTTTGAALHLPVTVQQPQLMQLQGRNFVAITPTTAQPWTLGPGQYRLRFVLSGDSRPYSRDLQVTGKDQALYVYTTDAGATTLPMAWVSSAPPNSSAYQQELLAMVCQQAEITSTEQQPVYPKAAYDACVQLDGEQHPRALLMLGYFYQHGLHVSKDLTKALALYSQAIDLDVEGAEPFMFGLLEEKKDQKTLLNMLNHLAKQGSPRAQALLARYIMDNKTANKDEHRARELSEMAFDGGMHHNTLLLAQYFYDHATSNEQFVKAKAYTELHRVSSDTPSKALYLLEAKLAKVPTSPEQVAATKLALLQHGNANAYGTVCVEAASNALPAGATRWSVAVNAAHALPSVPTNQSLLLRYLPIEQQQYQLYIRVGNDTVASKPLDFAEMDGLDMCLRYHDKEWQWQVNAGATACSCRL